MEEYMIKCIKEGRVYNFGPFKSLKRAEETLVTLAAGYENGFILKKNNKTGDIVSLRDEFFQPDADPHLDNTLDLIEDWLDKNIEHDEGERTLTAGPQQLNELLEIISEGDAR